MLVGVVFPSERPEISLDLLLQSSANEHLVGDGIYDGIWGIVLLIAKRHINSLRPAYDALPRHHAHLTASSLTVESLGRGVDSGPLTRGPAPGDQPVAAECRPACSRACPRCCCRPGPPAH